MDAASEPITLASEAAGNAFSSSHTTSHHGLRRSLPFSHFESTDVVVAHKHIKFMNNYLVMVH
jgi:hypothetical protein